MAQSTDAGGWHDVTLGAFVSLQRGHDLPEYDRRPGDVPVMGSFGVTGSHDEARAKGPGVTIGRSGASFGVVSFCARDYWPLNTCLYVTDFHGNDERFAYYLLKSLDLRRYNSGSAQPSLNRNYVRDIPIRIPILPEQRRVARTLGAFDDKIELNRRMSRTLESIANAIFKSWFIDFDPVRKKMEGGGGELPAGLAILRLSEPSLFALDGWQNGRLGDLVSVGRESVSPSDIENEVVDHFSIPAFDAGRAPSREAGASIKSNKFAVRTGSVLLSRLNPRTPRVWMPTLDHQRLAICSTEFLVLKPRPPVTIEYLYGLLQSNDFAERMASRVTGTSGSHQRVRSADALAIPVARPPSGLMGRYSTLTNPLLGQAHRLIEENGVLTKLRDALLPRLLSGELAPAVV